MTSETYCEDALIGDLRIWWDGEVGDNDPFANPRPATGTIFDVIPAVDSLGVVNGLLTIEKHVGFEVSPRIVRPGGYASFEDMTADLLPKVRAIVERRRSIPCRKDAA